MRTVSRPASESLSITSSSALQAALVAFGLAAPIATYAIAVSTIPAATKVSMLVGLSLVYVAVCAYSIVQIRKAHALAAAAARFATPIAGRSELEHKLSALEDAGEFFGSSLKPADMFRLVSNRVNAIVPFETCVLLVKEPETGQLRVAQAFGSNSTILENAVISADETLAGLSYLSGEIEATADLAGDRNAFPAGALKGMRSSAALALAVDGDTFAVFQLFFRSAEIPEEAAVKFEAIAERIAPLFLGAMAYERSLGKALSDPLTNLPNERAFHMVLENQLAESQRFRDERPLTVLAIDIRNFDEINHHHGHAAGDRALAFAAEKIASQLRKMDFLARSMNDEFLIVLPKASERTAIDITARIHLCLSNAPFKPSPDEDVKIWLNFGWATFWKDGETAHQLIQGAYARKQQAKSEDAGSVVQFPREYVN